MKFLVDFCPVFTFQLQHTRAGRRIIVKGTLPDNLPPGAPIDKLIMSLAHKKYLELYPDDELLMASAMGGQLGGVLTFKDSEEEFITNAEGRAEAGEFVKKLLAEAVEVELPRMPNSLDPLGVGKIERPNAATRNMLLGKR